ncbi:Transcription factor GTE4 [Dichanthelium oligosanthes]|uniref:Transcription factor GTE4 n=1 Tax=Dichanthelium oligosanthes TaxID=888268 RepID=A0A1E5V8M5_9POAL|nr:Transcription factor GTE4 [Dichanthelium oligosanthes]
MASTPPGDGDGGGSGEAAAGPAPAASSSPSTAPSAPIRSRWASEIKVYSRKYPRKNPKPPPPPPTEPAPAPNPNPLSETQSSIRRSIRVPEDGVAAAARPDPAAPSSTPPLFPDPAAPSSTPPLFPDPAATSSTPPSFPDPAATSSTPPSFPDPAAPASSPPAPPPPLAPAPPGEPTPASGDISPGLNRDGGAVPNGNGIDWAVDGGAFPNGHGEDWAVVALQKAEKAQKRRARSELRRQLASELDQVRVLSKRLKAAAEALVQQEDSVAMPLAMMLPPSQVVDAGYIRSQFSPTGPVTPVPAQAAFAHLRSQLPRAPLTVSVVHTEPFEKEKRTPKANQLYQNSEFLLAKDKFPPADPHGRKKSKSHKKKHRSLEFRGADFDAERRLYSHAFKKSSSLLSRLMKHKFAWVFNKPVDPVALHLHDYFAIIRHPMDLGTVRARLSHGQYRNPKEFAEDVRLTFHNAMTYNPKGQDVHIMAEQLLGIFEAQWLEIEAEVNYLASCPPLPKKFPPPPIDLRFLDRLDSVKHHAALESNSRPISHTPTRPPSMKKPRARDPNKRNMTMDEKRKLSENLQNLPPEKLDAVVQLIKNKNLSVRQHDDEIEVEIDSMDAETLWELDRFVANYKKNLSKQKRRAERALLARQDAELRAQHSLQQLSTEKPNVGEKSPKQNLMEGEQLASSVPNQNDNNGQDASRSSNSSSSSSDSGSSSSDSDSDSSSSDGSDAANSS